MSKATLDRRISEDKSLEIAIEQGRSKSIEQVASTAYQMATSGKCPAMTMFWLKCMAGWNEHEKSENNSEEPKLIVICRDDQPKTESN